MLKAITHATLAHFDARYLGTLESRYAAGRSAQLNNSRRFPCVVLLFCQDIRCDGERGCQCGAGKIRNNTHVVMKHWARSRSSAGRRAHLRDESLDVQWRVTAAICDSQLPVFATRAHSLERYTEGRRRRRSAPSPCSALGAFIDAFWRVPAYHMGMHSNRFPRALQVLMGDVRCVQLDAVFMQGAVHHDQDVTCFRVAGSPPKHHRAELCTYIIGCCD